MASWPAPRESRREAKLITVAEGDPNFDRVQDLDQLPEHLLRELENFFDVYKMLEPGDLAGAGRLRGPPGGTPRSPNSGRQADLGLKPRRGDRGGLGLVVQASGVWADLPVTARPPPAVTSPRPPSPTVTRDQPVQSGCPVDVGGLVGYSDLRSSSPPVTWRVAGSRAQPLSGCSDRRPVGPFGIWALN